MTLTMDFQGQFFLNSPIPGMGKKIDMEWKGWELIGCWTHYEVLKFDNIHELDHGFSRSVF